MTLSGRAILVVDDSGTVRRMIASALKPLGPDVLQAENGLEGLDLLRTRSVDLIIVDLNMPLMDGITMISAVRMMPEKGHVPIIMLTTESRDQDMALAYEAGADLYLVKPSSPPVIRYKVQALLGVRGEDQEAV